MRPRCRRTSKGVLINGVYRAPDIRHSRLVYLYRGYVVKLDAGPQNWKEHKNWLRIRPEDRRYFAEVVAFSHAKERRQRGITWLIQRRVKLRPGRPTRATCALVAELAQRYMLDDLDCGYVREYNHRNWGVRSNGDPVIFDYAY